MRILLDEQLPRQLAPYLIGFQQNISHLRLGVVVLRAKSNALEDLPPLIPAALTAIKDVLPGHIVRVD